MKRLTLINLEINSWNGFVFTFIGIDYGKFEGELFGLHFGGNSLYDKSKFLFINFLFRSFTIVSPLK